MTLLWEKNQVADIVERVARAIWDDACPGMEWGEIDKMTYEGWARVAIEAMREPTISAIRRNGLLGYGDMIDEAVSPANGPKHD
jgi:hypothetical protein